MTRKPAHKPAGTSDGGQFTTTAHREPSVVLTPQEKFERERARPLTVNAVEALQRQHGTYDPGEVYYANMPKVFDAAKAAAAASPEGRRELALRAKAEELSEITGATPKDIRDFYDEISTAEPGTEGWENLLQTYCEHYFRAPRGTGVFIESQMREAGKPVTERAALVASVREAQARVDALDINEAAASLRRRYPSAATIEARTTGEDDVVWAELRDADGSLLTAGDTDDPEFFTELDNLNLVPDKHHLKSSPLRSCVTADDETWVRRYDLDKMAALTADKITGEKK